VDPNEKSGPTGAGVQHFVLANQRLPYSISFENKSDATAPAQNVTITDQLDLFTIDLTTFNFGTIQFSDRIIHVPAGQLSFTTFQDLRPVNNITVQIDANLDTSTGLITWKFTSLDPDTGLPPEDPLAGFLPPNIIDPQGAGVVSFSVLPKPGLQTGTVIRNQASIVFDTNAPIVTNEWFNTIDDGKPGSHVQPLAPKIRTNSFTVNWSGADGNSGILGYTIFVSTDGGPFLPWLTNTNETSALFTGEDEHTYSFYSRARNNAGNLEGDRGVADTTTFVTFGSNGVPFIVSSIKGSLKFDAKGAAACTLSGSIANLDPAFLPNGTAVTIGVDDGKVTFVLDAKGKAKSTSGTFVLTTKRKDPMTHKPVFGGGPVTFKASIKTTAWANFWKANGILPSVKPQNSTRSVYVAVQLGAFTYSTSVDAKYKSSAKSGTFSFKR